MNTTRVAAAIAAGAALLTLTPLAAHAAAPVKAWGQGSLRPGSYVDVYATCSGASATVTGPAGMTAKLSPLADRAYLGAELVVPKSFNAGTANFTVVCANGSKSSFTLGKATTTSARLVTDGKLGPKTISALQRYVGVAQTGRLDKTTVKAVQVTFGREAYGTNNRLKVDGIMGPRTVKAIQAAIRCNLDSGRLDSRTVLALQTMLNQSGTR